MKTKFKVGDRVRVRYVSAVGLLCDAKATVVGVTSAGAVELEKDGLKGEIQTEHPDNLIRLKKKEPRRVALSIAPDGAIRGAMWWDTDAGKLGDFFTDNDVIEFIEAKKP